MTLFMATLNSLETEVTQLPKKKGGESVFHKMRNVLNSVHVSAGLINQHLRDFHVGDVGRIADMLEAHSHNLGWYLTQDPKGKKIPEFLGQLSQEFSEKHMTAMTELMALNDNLDQLEFLLTVGHSPEKTGGFKETIEFSKIMDEAISQHQEEMTRMGIQVKKEYQEVAEGILETTKLNPIVVNLIRNAINSMRDISEREHCLTLYVLPCPDREGFVRLQIQDTGRGIPTESLTKVFSPQTEDDESLFLPNLHSSAVSAKELGGSLRVWSNGFHQGAMFTLDLPVIHMEGDL